MVTLNMVVPVEGVPGTRLPKLMSRFEMVKVKESSGWMYWKPALTIKPVSPNCPWAV